MATNYLTWPVNRDTVLSLTIDSQEVYLKPSLMMTFEIWRDPLRNDMI